MSTQNVQPASQAALSQVVGQSKAGGAIHRLAQIGKAVSTVAATVVNALRPPIRQSLGGFKGSEPTATINEFGSIVLTGYSKRAIYLTAEAAYHLFCEQGGVMSDFIEANADSLVERREWAQSEEGQAAFKALTARRTSANTSNADLG